MRGAGQAIACAVGLGLGAAASGCADQVVGSFDASVGTTTGSTSEPGEGGSVSTGTDAPPSPSPEQCNGLDDDLDGLVDEVSAELSECDACLLLQGEGQAWWVCTVEETWDDAQAHCQTLGATSAIVPSAAAQAFLHAQVGEGWFWLGAAQDPGEGPFRWVDGVLLDYANWGTTQPDDTAPGQDCVRLTFGIVGDGWFDGAWDDFFCEEPHRTLCSAPHAAL